MFSIKKKIYIYILLLLSLSTFFLRYLFLSNKNRFLNNIYFNLPILFINKRKCVNYDSLIKKYLDDTYSLTLIDNNGNIIAEHNSKKLRLPASNMKLLSTAFVTSKFRNFDRLRTSLYIDKNKNIYYLRGSGDPDLSLNDIQQLLDKVKNNKIININLLEINEKLYWPEGWTSIDRVYKYGSPITQLAINSNSSRYININFLENYIKKYLITKYPKSIVNISILDPNNISLKNLSLVTEIRSNSIISLITLANAESHNFTSESLFKNASNTWSINNYKNLYYWLKRKGLPMNGILIKDASGLSRSNKLTTNLLASFLHKMKFHKNHEFYTSSLSILGVRGTLSNKFSNASLRGKFFGKTGTLSNTFSLSGYLLNKKKIYSLSIIQNSKSIDKINVFNLLMDLHKIDKCN